MKATEDSSFPSMKNESNSALLKGMASLRFICAIATGVILAREVLTSFAYNDERRKS